MKAIKELPNIVITLEDNSQTSKVIDSHKSVPTLGSGVYRKASPMLKVRYELFGKRLNTTHRDRLNTEEMESFRSEGADDGRLVGTVRNVEALMGNWKDHVTGLFALNRVSISVASNNSHEMICLTWFDGMEGPELWVYDYNGESRYRDLASYLQAYIDDDVSAPAVKRKLADT